MELTIVRRRQLRRGFQQRGQVSIGGRVTYFKSRRKTQKKRGPLLRKRRRKYEGLSRNYEGWGAGANRTRKEKLSRGGLEEASGSAFTKAESHSPIEITRPRKHWGGYANAKKDKYPTQVQKRGKPAHSRPKKKIDHTGGQTGAREAGMSVVDVKKQRR